MKHIALIEDNADNRLLVSAILEDLFEVVEYESGNEALANLPQEHPDLILLDISLPEMDGTEVFRQLKAVETLKLVPVIALTAHAMSGDRERYLTMGFDGYISKPIVDDSEFIKTIRNCLHSAS